MHDKIYNDISIANRVDPDQVTLARAVWCCSALFAIAFKGVSMRKRFNTILKNNLAIC